MKRVVHDHELSNAIEHVSPQAAHHDPPSVSEGESAADLEIRLARIEALLESISKAVCSNEPKKELYTTAEAAKILGKRPFTVREWCRLGRVHATKTHAGHGIDAEWRISHEELLRIQNEGLLPVPARY